MVSRNKRRWRLAKTFILAVAATAVLVWSAINTWDVDPQEMLEFFLLCIVLLLVLAIPGALGAMLIAFVRRRREK